MKTSPVFVVWRYRRVSTDDKGQDLRRQDIATDAWVLRESAAVAGSSNDEGVSATFTNPFERAGFLAACEGARGVGARGVLAESVDRVCGQGSDELGWTRTELRRRFGLELFFADAPLALHGSLAGNVSATVGAEVRRERIALDRKRIKEGIAHRRAKGLPVGGAAQRKVNPDLVALVERIARENPSWGARRIARRASLVRGADALDIPERERRKRKVTHGTVRRALASLAHGGDAA